MMKNKFKIVLVIIVSVIIASEISVYATYNYFAKDIKYKKDDGTEVSVEYALNELYNKRQLKYYGSNSNTRAVWSAAENSLKTSYEVEKGEYIVVVVGEISTQHGTTIGEGSFSFNVNASEISKKFSENILNSYSIVHNATNVGVYYINIDNAQTLEATFTGYYAMEQQIILQIFKI